MEPPRNKTPFPYVKGERSLKFITSAKQQNWFPSRISSCTQQSSILAKYARFESVIIGAFFDIQSPFLYI